MTCANARVQRSFWVDEEITEISRPAVSLLGIPGRTLYPKRSMRQPSTIFNANIFDGQGKKIWHGDLEIERDREALTRLSLRVGTIYILYESDGRFFTQKPSLDFIRARTALMVEKGRIMCTRDFAERVRLLKQRMGIEEGNNSKANAEEVS